MAVAANTQTDIQIALATYLATAATLIQGKFEVRVTDSYQVPLSIFTCCFADASAGKGPVFKAITGPLQNLAMEYNQRHQEDREKDEMLNKNIDAQLRNLRKKLGRPSVDNEELYAEIAELESRKRKVDSEIVLYTQDVRKESFAQLAGTQPGERISILDPEGGCLRSLIDVPNLLPLLHQGYSGEPVRIDRQKYPSVNLDHAHISIGVLAQPDKLNRLKMYHHLWEEGFFPRMLSFFAQPFMGLRQPLGPEIPPELTRWYEQRLRLLFEYPWNGEGCEPYVLHLSQDAQTTWQQFAMEITNQSQLTANRVFLGPWFGKMKDAVIRVAAIYHLMEADSSELLAPIGHMEMYSAVSLVVELIPSAERIYRTFFPDPVWEAVSRVREWILRNWNPMGNWTVTARKICQNLRLKVEVVEAALGYLCGIHAIERVNPYPSPNHYHREYRTTQLILNPIAEG